MTSSDLTATEGGKPGRYPYRSAAEVSRLSVIEQAYVVALLLAAAADLAAFHQIVDNLAVSESPWMNMVLVVGLTASSLVLAHYAGRFARDVTAGHGGFGWRAVLIPASLWLLMGLAAFWARMIAPSPVGGGLNGPQPTDSLTSPKAVLFLALYLGSGMVAALGEFVVRNPLRSGYRRALRGYQRAQRKLRKSMPAYERALHVYELHRSALAEENDPMYAAARNEWIAHGDYLKEHSAVRIAEHLGDPSATDGMTVKDWRPRRSDDEGSPGPGEPRPPRPTGPAGGPDPFGRTIPQQPVNGHRLADPPQSRDQTYPNGG